MYSKLKSYENYSTLKQLLDHMLYKNFKEKNKNFVLSKLPKFVVLPKNAV